MQPINQKRFYSPQFSELAAVSVRRLSWAMGVPMPAAVNIMVQLVTSFVDPSKVGASVPVTGFCVVSLYAGTLVSASVPVTGFYVVSLGTGTLNMWAM